MFVVVFAALLVVLDGATDAVLMTEVDKRVVTTAAAVVVAAPVTVGDVVAAPVPLDEGAATALLGSVSAPVPQGIAAPPGCVAFVGVVVAPESEAMAKRPVQVVFAAAGAVNW